MRTSAVNVSYKGPLFEMTQTTPTCLWNDSASIEELAYSIEHGAVGATCNPVIAYSILEKEMATWRKRIEVLLQESPDSTEDEITWKLIEELSVRAAHMLEPIFEAHGGRNGRLSIQTDPRMFRSTRLIVDQATEFNGLAPNMIIKIPVTRAGIPAIEEATYQGISINATVCFTLSQCVAVAEAVERGLRRREAESKDISTMGPVCTIMVGRLDDWLKLLLEKNGVVVDPGCLEWAGIAVFKKAYRIFRERGYRLRLLSAAFRNHMHWSELIGGDIVISPPCAWQRRFNRSDIEVVSRIDDPVDQKILSQLLSHFEDFCRAYSEDGIPVEEFDNFGPTRRTLRQFIAAVASVDSLVRDIIVPNPDDSSP